ncbi:MAG: hypothetical protein PHE06_10630 [Lachnospiraceae bacterium]|nr:hypothetical protein [Lachnospiraceae bacterium]MDD3796404.1 hypothetical protein [Lachnospiraceae bacterium]
MSQAKVDRYKEEKKNRGKIVKKQKMEWLLTKIVLAVFAVALAGWAGVSVYQNVTTSGDTTAETESYTVNTGAIDDYLSTLPIE